MIEPIFIDDTEKHLHSCFPGSEGTVLRLPFDCEAERNIDATNVKVHLAFNGKLLLYLNKLSSMELHDKQKDRWVRHMRRTIAEQLSGTWISLTTEERSYRGAIMKQESYWYRKTIEFEPRVKRGKYSVDSTKVSIAVCFQVKDALNTLSTGSDGTETLTEEKGENEGVKCRQLVFDSNQPTYPIYAFLPTKIVIFRFVLQGDFILPSNRESCKEDSPWNRKLLEMVPDLFVDLILDVAGSVRLGELSVDGAVSVPATERCLQSPTPEHSIAVTSDNLKSLLPRKSLNTAVPMYVELISNMYSKLSREPFLRCSSGATWPSSQLVSTQHLSFDPTSFISEETLFACTGKRYITTSEITLDDELMELLRIVPFSADIISSCVEALAKTAFINLPCLAGLLLALEKLSAPSMTGTASLPALKQSLLLVPSQTFGKMKPTSTGNHHSKASLTEEKREVIRKMKKTCMMLRSLPIWPISTGAFSAEDARSNSRVPLDAQVVFIHGKVTPRISRCFKRIPSHRAVFLDEGLLDTAETMVQDGRQVLRNFLLNNFASSAKSSSDWGKSVREVSGGLEELSPKGLVHNVIVPLYASLVQQYEEAVDESESEHAGRASELDRVSASACLAIVYLSDMNVDDVLRKSVFLPTVTARVKKSNVLHWSPSARLRPSKLTVSRELGALSGDVQEVHLGLEFSDSSICRLEKQHIKTALMQVTQTLYKSLNLICLVFSLCTSCPEYFYNFFSSFLCLPRSCRSASRILS
jgi:hypothetical protein